MALLLAQLVALWLLVPNLEGCTLSGTAGALAWLLLAFGQAGAAFLASLIVAEPFDIVLGKPGA
jgi:hypothetical protein